MRITVRIFFKSITVRNQSEIPATGPLMVLANHPSTFMDPIVISTLLDRPVYFLAKGELFKGAFAKWLLPRFNMIPVYRKQDDPSQMSRNEETFMKCYEHLEQGGAILMFPEGVSITERKLKPIKSGAARIVLGAEARNDFKLNVQVLNIGLNYENPHRFNRKLFVNIDKPVRAADYAASYQADTYKGVGELSETIRQRLEKLIIGIEDKRLDELVANIQQLYGQKLNADLGIIEGDDEKEFLVTKTIVDTVNYYSIIQPQRVEVMRTRIAQYFSRLREAGIDDSMLSGGKKDKGIFGNGIRALLFIVAGFPLYLYGLINNFLPFEIPALAAKKISGSIEFRGAIGMVGGMFTFLIFYSVQIWLVWHFSHSAPITALYALTLPLSGFFCYWYYHTAMEIRADWKLLSLFYRRSALIAGLISERQSIIAEFEKAREEYSA